MSLLASSHSLRADNATVLARIDEVRALLDQREQSQQTLPDYLNANSLDTRKQSEELTKIHQRLTVQERTGQTLLETAKQALSGIFQVKAILVDLAEKVIHLQVMVSNATYTRGPDPTKELPIILEDTLGSCLTLPEDWIHDWEVRIPGHGV